MRALELAKVAAAAEALRVKRFARRQGIRIALAATGALFLIAFFTMLHVVAVILLSLVVRLWIAALIVMAVDVVIGAILGMVALHSRPDRIEIEAAVIRRQSLAEAKAAATSLATIGEVAGLAIGITGRRRAKSTRVGKAWMVADLASRFIRQR